MSSDHSSDDLALICTDEDYSFVRGEQHYNAKLTETQVVELRRTWRRKQRLKALIEQRYGEAVLAEKLGVSRRAIERAVAGETWKCVPDFVESCDTN